ncbi:MAG: tRNA (adenosine(37)-N6)-threonylcarbamoyltransferase complex ATPase subunit type 1 TsaE [Candidatus Omnitrophota bacterium]|nr:tRNA (adenosine(37)-N6)-threonylcarbamoyltransferase complex ATPase subunit type 1 TsaE [Candidatus Omnitrophota bacterium]
MGLNISDKVVTRSPEETVLLGAKIGAELKKGDLIALSGDLGAGKTMLVKGIAKGLGIDDYMYVNSPSFVILKEYRGREDLYHFDVYRLDEEGFSETLDHEKYFYGNGITVVEWACNIKGLLPDKYIEITAEHGKKEKERIFKIKEHV